jgi:hypothetical protein
MMAGSRARRLAALVAAFLPAAALAAEQGVPAEAGAVVVAQSGPVRLIPRERQAPPPEAEGEKSPAPAPDAPFSTPAPRRNIQDIEVNTLRGPDPDEAGPLYADNGGFGNALWDGMSRDLILRLTRQIPAGMSSPAMRDIVRRMLLTAAVLPPRSGEGGASLIATRVDRLQAMGLLGSAGELIAAAPNRDKDDVLRRLRAENALMRNDLGGACAETARQSQNPGELFWQQLQIYCQAVRGDTGGASLSANLLAETRQLDDPAFFALVDRLVSGNAVTIETLPQPSPLTLSMMRTANVPVPVDAIEKASPPLLAMIGASPKATTEVRLEAAERAARLGALTADRLAEGYGSVTFSKEDLDNALTVAEVDRTPRGRALLYQAALLHTVPTARAAVIQKGIVLAREDNRYGLVVRVYETLLTGLTPTGELAWFAADACRALYALGRADLARGWLDELRRQAPRDAEATTAVRTLWPIAILAEAAANAEKPPEPANPSAAMPVSPVAPNPQPGGVVATVTGGPQQSVTVIPVAPAAAPAAVTAAMPEEGEKQADLADIRAWREALQTAAPETAAGKVADGLMLLSAAGIVIGDEAWQLAMGHVGRRTTVSPDPGYRAMLSRAAAQGRRGEAILLAALIVGEKGVTELDMAAIAEVVSAMRQIGLNGDALKLALEVAVRTGL